jgi:dymeclin
LAALANMSSQFSDLHPYVSQRLVSLFETLAKKHSRLATDVAALKRSKTKPPSDSESEMEQDLCVLEDVLRMVLEILNSCLTHQLASNPNLIYTLLYKKEAFEVFKSHPAFQDVVCNIDLVFYLGVWKSSSFTLEIISGDYVFCLQIATAATRLW